jgi:hypothetical protein
MQFEEEFYKDVRSVLYLFRCNFKISAELFKILGDAEALANYDLMIEGKDHLKLSPSMVKDFGRFFMDHHVIDGYLKARSNVHHFNFLKAFQYYLESTQDI